MQKGKVEVFRLEGVGKLCRNEVPEWPHPRVPIDRNLGNLTKFAITTQVDLPINIFFKPDVKLWKIVWVIKICNAFLDNGILVLFEKLHIWNV
jgi:hypothetical protein